MLIPTTYAARSPRATAVGLLIAVLLAAALVTDLRPAAANQAVQVTDDQKLGHGVQLSTFSVSSGEQSVTGHVVTANLADSRVRLGLLHPFSVAQRSRVSTMTADQHAVAGVNGDFFNIDESQHPKVKATGASNGPEVTSGHALKAAVPDAQRFGPAMAPGTSTRDVIGVGTDGRAHLGSLRLRGWVRAPGHRYRLGGLNQYALPEDGIGAFTHAWGDTSRTRAVCGSDSKRGAPCSDDVAEVTLRRGRVAKVADRVGSGKIAQGETVLVGREQGARQLRKLRIGQPVVVRNRLVASPEPFQAAVGGAPILRHGSVLSGVDDKVAATRTGAGVSRDGSRVYMVALDGSSESGGGLTLRQLGRLLTHFGAADGVNLDGGGSTTCAARSPASGEVKVVSKRPAGVPERPVANGLGVWTS